MERWGLLVVVAMACAPARAADAPPPDPYPGASETRVLQVGQTLDYAPPGVVTQLICDHVGELIAVTADQELLHIKALAPGVTACSLTGVRNRDDAPATEQAPDGGRSGILDYRLLVELRILPPAAPAPEKK